MRYLMFVFDRRCLLITHVYQTSYKYFDSNSPMTNRAVRYETRVQTRESVKKLCQDHKNKCNVLIRIVRVII